MAIARALYMETSTNAQPAEALTNSGDNTIYTASYAPFAFSAGDPEVLPYGVETGCEVTPDTTNDQVDIAAGTVVMADHSAANSSGRVSVAAATLAVTRPASSNVRYEAIVVNSAGTPAYAVVNGTDNATFVDTVGAAGGPPEIPDGQILVALVKLDSNTSALILETEILQFAAVTSGPTSQERWDYPGWKDPILNFAKTVDGQVEFHSALPVLHASSATKRVVLKGRSANLTRIPNIGSYSPPSLSISSSSTETFDGTIAATTTSVTDGSFEVAKLTDGIRDDVVKMKGKRVLVRFYEDESDTNRVIWAQGICVPSRTFEGKTSPTATVTLGAQADSIEKTS